MALVKTSKIASRNDKPARAAPRSPEPRNRARPAAVGAERLAERIAAATEELAAGLTEASAAAEELQRAMEQIAAGSEEAAGGSQAQLSAVREIVASLSVNRAQAEVSRKRAETLQAALTEASVQISASVRAIERNAERQSASVMLINELERRAQEIGAITQTVSGISDQTNLLALNAAIEAARAGDQGLGFAVVADEVRALAETSDRSAQQVQTLAATIQTDVQGVVEAIRDSAAAAAGEASAGVRVIEALTAIRQDMAATADGSQEVLTAGVEAERAAEEAQRGAELVASSAEQQSAAASQAQTAILQQTRSLDQGQIAAQALAEMSERLRGGVAEAAAAEDIAAAAEELSAAIQELSGAATQIMAAVEQINRGSQQQAAATQEASAALAQIETGARIARDKAAVAVERIAATETTLTESRSAMGRLIAGVETSLGTTRQSLTVIVRLEDVGRRIQAMVDEITLVAVQTSMLAVSGSVEAARAGASGRGFATVSGDIRTLAREASQGVAAIKGTVVGILDQIATLRRDLEQMIAAAEVEVQNNRAVSAMLETLSGEVASLRHANAEIDSGADAILQGAMQTAGSAQQIAAAAEEASAASRQAAMASNQQARGAEDLAAAIEEIVSLADELNRQNARPQDA